MFSRFPSVLISLLMALPALVRAAPGEPDPTYDVRCSRVGEVRVIGRQSDGKLLIGGDFVYVGGLRRPSIARVNADGSGDASFNAGNGITHPFTYYTIHALAVQADGKILVGGLFAEFNGLPADNLIRLNADGSRDASFQVTFSLPNFSTPIVYALGVQSDGKILVGGYFETIQGAARTNLARLNANGSLDTGFTVNATQRVAAIVPANPDGWFIGGGFTELGGLPRSGLARLQADGSVSATFTPPVLAAGTFVFAIAPMADGRLLYGGYQPTATNATGFVGRLLADGSADPTLVPPPTGGQVNGLAILDDGSILVGGAFNAVSGLVQGSLFRMASSGSPSTSFATGSGSPVHALRSLADGTAVFGGSVLNVGEVLQLGMGHIQADGTLDPDFHPDVTTPATVRKILGVSGGRQMVAGGFDAISAPSAGRAVQPRLGRLGPTSLPDAQFLTGRTLEYFNAFNAVAEQSDGRVVAGGDSNSSAALQLVHRFNGDGSRDSGFATAFGAFEVINDVVMQTDGKIVVGGQFAAGVVRLLPTGVRDTTFSNPGLGTANDLALLAGGKVLAGGSNYVVRLQADGTFDASFKRTLTVNGPVHAVAALPGQRSLIAGDFTTVNGQSSGRIARLLANGDPDPTFSAGVGANATVRAIAVRSDGEIFLTGDFQTCNGLTRTRLVQLSPDGAVRTGFDPLLGLDASGYTLAFESSGALLVGGAFTTVNGLVRLGLARVTAAPLGTVPATPPAPGNFSATAVARNQVLLVWSAVSAATGFVVERSADGISGWLTLGSPGGNATSFTDTTAAPGQTYYYRVIPWNAGGDALVNAINPVSLPAPETLPGGVLPGVSLDLWASGDVRAIARQPDGKVIVGGNFKRVQGSTRVNLARLNVDGSLDVTFDVGTGPSGTVNTVAVQPDGKIVAGGGSSGTPFLERYLADGSRDSSFATADRANNTIYSLLILPDGGIMVGGAFSKWGTASRNYLARLNSDGTLNAGYSSAYPSGTVLALALQSDGKVLFAGGFGYVTNADGSGFTLTRVARLKTDGARDTSFGALDVTDTAGATDAVRALAVQSDGKILLGGSFNRLGAQTLNRIVRLTTTGTLDATFNAGTGASATVYAVGQLSDGRIAVGGNFDTFAGSSRRGFAVLSTAGALMGSEVAVFPPTVRALVAVPGGQCVLTGPFHGVDGSRRQAVARILGDGNTADVTFVTSLSRPGQVYGMAAQSDGKTVILGDFTSVGGPDDAGVPRYQVLRLEADDSIDASFQGPFGIAGAARVATVGSNGKIWIGGDFTAVGLTTRNQIARLLTDGTLDTAFDPGAGLSGAVNALVAEADGGATAGGAFNSAAGQTRNNLARFSATGALTTAFSSAGANSFVNVLARQTDGKLLVGGIFSSIESQSRNRLARLNSDGTVDLSFDPAPDGAVTRLVLRTDGRLLVSGSFSTIGGALRYRLARLLATGAYDATFAPPVESTNSVSHLMATADGGCIVAGSLTGMVAYRTLQMARFFQSGAFYPAFDVGRLNDVSPIAGVVSPTRILLGGSFQSFSGQPHFGLVKLRAAAAIVPPSAPASLVAVTLDRSSVSIAWSKVNDEAGYIVERSPFATNSWQTIAAVAPGQTRYADAGLAAGSAWKYRVSAYNAAGLSALSNVLPVSLPGSYAEWRVALGIAPSTLDEGDLDGDGWGIFAEYALGFSPWLPDVNSAPFPTLANGRLEITYRRADTEAICTVQAASDLTDWTAAGVDQGGAGPWVTAWTPYGTDERKFLRLLITWP